MCEIVKYKHNKNHLRFLYNYSLFSLSLNTQLSYTSCRFPTYFFAPVLIKCLFDEPYSYLTGRTKYMMNDYFIFHWTAWNYRRVWLLYIYEGTFKTDKILSFVYKLGCVTKVKVLQTFYPLHSIFNFLQKFVKLSF